MDEAKQFPGGRFEGMVGTIEPPVVPPDASVGGSEEAAEEAAEDSVNVDHVTNRVANRFSEAVLTKDYVGRTFLLRGDKCPAEEVLFGTSDEIDSPERARRLTITIAAAPFHTSEKLSALQMIPASLWGSLFTGCLTILLNATMSHFKPGGSTPDQRVWTMMWLSVVTANPVLSGFEETWSTRARAGARSFAGNTALQLLRIVTSLIAIARVYVPSIGGFVVVVQMLREYGTCIRITDGDT